MNFHTLNFPLMASIETKNIQFYMQALNRLETSFPTGGGVKQFWKKEGAPSVILHPDTIVV